MAEAQQIPHIIHNEKQNEGWDAQREKPEI